MVLGFVYFEKFAEKLYKLTGKMQLIWLLQKDLFHMLKTNHMHWKLHKAKDILINQFEGFHPEKNTLHKGGNLTIRLDHEPVHPKHHFAVERNVIQRAADFIRNDCKLNQKNYIYNTANKDNLRHLVPNQFWGLCSRKPISVFRNDLNFEEFPFRKDSMLKLIEYPVKHPFSQMTSSKTVTAR